MDGRGYRRESPRSRCSGLLSRFSLLLSTRSPSLSLSLFLSLSPSSLRKTKDIPPVDSGSRCHGKNGGNGIGSVVVVVVVVVVSRSPTSDRVGKQAEEEETGGGLVRAHHLSGGGDGVGATRTRFAGVVDVEPRTRGPLRLSVLPERLASAGTTCSPRQAVIQDDAAATCGPLQVSILLHTTRAPTLRPALSVHR